MKVLLIVIGLCFVCSTNDIDARGVNLNMETVSIVSQESIEDGWYNATIIIRYESGNVTKESVQVKVEIGYVVEVVLPDGKTYHSGYNTEAYEYYNGRISYKSLSEDKTDAATTVEIKDINGGVNLMILLEDYKSNRMDDRL